LEWVAKFVLCNVICEFQIALLLSMWGIMCLHLCCFSFSVFNE
jgi:hypothetical protein